MLTIDLDAVKHWKFPAGEVGIKLPNDFNPRQDSKVWARLRNSDDIMKLIMVRNAIIESRGIYNNEWFKDRLVVPYIPYGRQDRICNPGESFSLRAFAQIINSFKFNNVITYDIHSAQTTKEIHNCENLSNASLFLYALERIKPSNLLLIAPDKGAHNRVLNLTQYVGHPWGDTSLMVSAQKERDLSTGKIISYTIDGDFTGKDCLICDDICDGGATFVSLATALKAQGARSVHLRFSHGIFSKGLEPLYAAGVDTIWTTDSYYRDDASRGLDLDKREQVYKLYNEI